ncbi:MAG: RnfABCDGE type electron transport complex subunit D [bacterium]
MFDILIASIPIIFVSLYVYGIRSVWIILVSIISSVVTEIAIQILRAKKFLWREPIHSLVTSKEITFTDGSALITGLLLAFTLPVSVPFWIPVIGSCVAISSGKQVFGGLGNNIFNPALVGRAFLLASWPTLLTKWTGLQEWPRYINQLNMNPKSWLWIDAATRATPLEAVKLSSSAYSSADLLIGHGHGCLGELSALAVLLGALYLLYKGTITWHIPVTYVGTVFLLSFILGNDPFYQILAGGLMLGAFFMSTDPVTSPMTKSGRIYLGAILGVLTVVIRNYGGYPEGVCYAILIGNGITPLIDRMTRPKPIPAG